MRLWSVTNDSIEGVWAKLRTAWQAPYSRVARRELSETIADFGPDVVHVHNFFPLITPSVYDACAKAHVPVVQTLHNYRLICAGTLLTRRGRPCEDCIGASPYLGALHGCYRGSRLGSLAVARMIDRHKRQGTWDTKVDRFIALTEFARNRFGAAGLPLEKIVVKPNFVHDMGCVQGDAARSDALYVGRLSPEKGIDTLLKAWLSLEAPLRVIGGGPMLDRVRAMTHPQLTSLGHQSPEVIAEEMARASVLVMPSICYETFGLVIVEAFSHELPVIASRLGAMAEIIEDGVTGLHFRPGDSDDLAEKVRWAMDHPEDMRRMGVNARRVYEEKYTPEVNYRKLIAIYEEAIRQPRP